MNKRIIKIDASKKTFGRLASEVAHAVQGKLFPDSKRHQKPSVEVQISNITQVQFTGKKLIQTSKKKHSGFPGGFSSTTLLELFQKNPEQTFRNSVRNMLPKNTLRKQMLKNITFTK